jgi:hypothetical protein
LQREDRVQLDQLAGTAIDGTGRLSETAINELLNDERSPVRGATISVAPDNELIFRYGVVRARVMLPFTVDVGSAPQVRLRLASYLVALGLSAAVRLPYLRVDGRDVTIFIADIPALRPLRDVWQHVKSASLRTESGAVVMDFNISVAGGA